MVSQPIQKVWINPPKYWAATAGMSEDEIANLLEQVVNCARAGDLEALRKFDFVWTEDFYLRWREARRASLRP